MPLCVLIDVPQRCETALLSRTFVAWTREAKNAQIARLKASLEQAKVRVGPSPTHPPSIVIQGLPSYIFNLWVCVMDRV
jgi:hypothetical protein